MQYLIKEIKKRTKFIVRISRSLSLTQTKTLYSAFVQSVFEYACPIWSSGNALWVRKVFSALMSCLASITRVPMTTRRSLLFISLDLLPPEQLITLNLIRLKTLVLSLTRLT